MNNVEHCMLCDHKMMDFIFGVTCSKTKKSPSSQTKCDAILLNEEMEAKIIEVNLKLELVLLTKVGTIFHVSFFLLLALTLIFFGYYFIDLYAVEMYKSLDKRDAYNLVAIFVVFLSGFLVLPIAIGPLNNYRKKISLAKANKMRVDKVLKLYGWSYQLNVDIGKAVHGDRKFNYNLKMFRVKAAR